MLYKTIIINLFIFLSINSLFAQANSVQKNQNIFEKYTESLNKVPENKLFIETAIFFLNSPYKAGTLEINPAEQLVVNLQEFDCTTLIESCVALYLTARNNPTNYDEFTRNLQFIRYRGGKADGYTSRLHYVTDWISDNVQKGIITDRTKPLGGIPLKVNVSYMSKHPMRYPALTNDPRLIARMENIEKAINNRKDTYYYIPKDKINSAQNNIQTGDIIFFTTSIDGLDVTHAGIAYRENDKLTFIHASSKHEKVLINPESLADYCASSKSNTGIMVVRLK